MKWFKKKHQIYRKFNTYEFVADKEITAYELWVYQNYTTPKSIVRIEYDSYWKDNYEKIYDAFEKFRNDYPDEIRKYAKEKTVASYVGWGYEEDIDEEAERLWT